ncbi:MAG: lysine exporter LysO family protein [Paraprevotella sp.]|nr:lysine exporter LysO family protein [Paraprevotella sp.]
MFIVLSVLWGSAVLGYLFRNRTLPGIGRLMTCCVWLLLFLMGLEVGGNHALMQAWSRLGTEAALLTVCTTLGCVLPSAWLWKRIRRTASDAGRIADAGSPSGTLPVKSSLGAQLTGSIIIAGFFLSGCAAGVSRSVPAPPSAASFWVLGLLLACVGWSIGHQSEIRRSLRHLDKRMVVLPLITLFGTWAGALLTACLLDGRSLSDWLAIGSGFGYYSLSSILITEARNAETGTVALLYNLLRELTALLCAPWFCRYFGPLATISVGGATSGDTTLPVISRVCGPAFVSVSVFHGLLVDLTVPFLVSFFCTL